MDGWVGGWVGVGEELVEGAAVRAGACTWRGGGRGGPYYRGHGAGSWSSERERDALCWCMGVVYAGRSWGLGAWGLSGVGWH
jgi:hypothetical protein